VLYTNFDNNKYIEYTLHQNIEKPTDDIMLDLQKAGIFGAQFLRILVIILVMPTPKCYHQESSIEDRFVIYVFDPVINNSQELFRLQIKENTH